MSKYTTDVKAMWVYDNLLKQRIKEVYKWQNVNLQ